MARILAPQLSPLKFVARLSKSASQHSVSAAKQRIGQHRQTTMPVFGAPEAVTQESPDAGGSAGSTDTAASSSSSAEDAPGEAPEPGGDNDEAMSGEVQIPQCVAHNIAVTKCEACATA